MSTPLAIASVTLVLKDLLNNGLIDHDITGILGGNVTVSCLPPDLINLSRDESPQLNLFMYMVSSNTGWQNMHLPSYNSRGDRISNPPLSLNLHYLLTAYCPDELYSEILLGYGMHLLHENPVLTRDAIRKSLALPSTVTISGLPANLQSLATSRLADQMEQIKITPEYLNSEELSKLWTAFQSKFRPSAAYLATVVLIESSKSTKTALPVKERNVYVRPFKQPVITGIAFQSQSGEPVFNNLMILHDYRLVINGYDLKVENPEVLVDGISMSPGPDEADIGDRQIIYQLPADLSAGIHGLQIAGRINMGTPETLHRGVESNIEAFVLHPEIISQNVSGVTGTGSTPRSGDISLTVKPAVGENQRILLLMNETGNPEGTLPNAYSFLAAVVASPPGPAENIVIPVTDVKAGTYLLRIQIDGADSPLKTDDQGKYISPAITIP